MKQKQHEAISADILETLWESFRSDLLPYPVTMSIRGQCMILVISNAGESSVWRISIRQEKPRKLRARKV